MWQLLIYAASFEGFAPDQLGSLQRSPTPLAGFKGAAAWQEGVPRHGEGKEDEMNQWLTVLHSFMDIIAQFKYISAFLVLLCRLYNIAFWLQFLINFLTEGKVGGIAPWLLVG